jgi:signal transduction histidine kinase/CheY-like chemotaxis protein
MSGEAILNILVDDYQHVWISTNKKITEFNPVNQTSICYTLSDGLIVNSFLKNSCCKGASGKIYFGGNRGICAFYPSKRLSDPSKSNPVLITDVKVQNISVLNKNENGAFNHLKNNLILEPEEKNIEIEFSTLNYIFSSKIRYAYKMDGIDPDWIYPENNRQFVSYNQLRKGKYVFRIIATDENGLWNKNETLLTIYRKPAFYETGWAYLSYVLIFLLVVYWGLWFYMNRLKLRNELKITHIEKEKSEELTQTKLRYFTNISHELLTPLTIISCLIDDIEMRSKGKFAQHEVMRSNINRLKRLLQQVLDFRKVESGNMKLKITQGEIVAFIKDICYANFSPLIEKKKIKFSFHAQPLLIPACFDADKIDKILFNLLSNAFKYTGKEGEIQVNLQRMEKNKRPFLEIKIMDAGTGISPKDLPFIFTRFYYNDTIQSGETNGIGLSLTKDLVELHHGTIRVESQLQKGTVFTVEIPIGKESYNKNEFPENISVLTAENPENEPRLELIEWDKETKEENTETPVLIVEDDEDLRNLISSILSKRYLVFTAGNGKEALAFIQEQKIEIIVSDVMMPEINGLELCRFVKNNLEFSHISVLLLTAKDSSNDKV